MEYLLFPHREEGSFRCIDGFSFTDNQFFCNLVIGGAHCTQLRCGVLIGGNCPDFTIPQRGINP